MPRLIRSAVLVFAVAVAAPLAGCGNKHAIVTKAHTEGIYLDVGPLDYQVQLSRYLNPAQVPDDSYVSGLAGSATQLQKGETWFGVFLRVQNSTKQAHQVATQFKITDTLDNVFTPTAIDTKSNPFAYGPKNLAPNDILPTPDSAAALDSAQGALILFKLPYANLQNRPLEFHIASPEGGPEGVVDLDL
jgi:hypothetical protein